jgi:hypothetical protein
MTIDRREFLKVGALASAGTLLIPSNAPAQAGPKPVARGIIAPALDGIAEVNLLTRRQNTKG